MSLFNLNKPDTLTAKDGSKIVTVYYHRDSPWQTKRIQTVTHYNAQGKKDGEEETYTYYKNKIVSRTNCPYENGEKHGTETEYDRNGKLIRETPWMWGGKIGIEKTYYPDGAPKSKIGYSGSAISDHVIYYYPNRKPRSEGWQKTEAYGAMKSVKCGDWREYTEDGDLSAVTTYHDDIALSRKDYYPGGRTVRCETFYHENKSITERTYRTNGSVEKDENFDDNWNQQGLRIVFDEHQGIDDFEYYINDDVLSLETLSEIVSIFGENSNFSPANMQKKSQVLRNDT